MQFDQATKFYIIRVCETKSVKVLISAPSEEAARLLAADGVGRGMEFAKRKIETEIVEEMSEAKYQETIQELNAWPNS